MPTSLLSPSPLSAALLSRSKFVFLTVAACAILALPALGSSQARIVRLSDVQGSVQIDKNSGTGFENAFLNLPITQGTQLRTGANGRAEVEFEDGSTLRAGPDSTIEFGTLELSDAGKRISAVALDGGMIYLNWLGKSGDSFALSFSSEKIALDGAAHIRVDNSGQPASVAVFKGEVEVDGASGKVVVAKNKTAKFDAADHDKYTLANNVVEAPLDSWDRESIAYHDQYAKTKSSDNSSPYEYGLSDLNYYGGYYNVPGYGMMWQPYFAGVGWDPFMDGAWGWYPGMGYMFASAYPWGWLPYYYGSWNYVPRFGWMWQAGGWNTRNSAPVFKPTTLVQVHALVAPTGSVNTVAVGRGGAVSPVKLSRVKEGSAGLGVPRGSIDGMSHLNREVAKRGFAEIHPEPQFSTSADRFGGFGAGHGAIASPATGHASGGGHAPAAVGGHR